MDYFMFLFLLIFYLKTFYLASLSKPFWCSIFYFIVIYALNSIRILYYLVHKFNFSAGFTWLKNIIQVRDILIYDTTYLKCSTPDQLYNFYLNSTSKIKIYFSNFNLTIASANGVVIN